eukprot:scaffold21311_cov18-Tisochrysis_lutea.AAC.1
MLYASCKADIGAAGLSAFELTQEDRADDGADMGSAPCVSKEPKPKQQHANCCFVVCLLDRMPRSCGKLGASGRQGGSAGTRDKESEAGK